MLSPGVRVLDGAHVRDSVIMTDAVIGNGAVIDNSIVDKGVVIGDHAVVGWGEDRHVVNELEPDRLTTGITVVGKYATVPPGVLLGRNVRVDALATADDYAGATVVASGRTIGHPVHQHLVAVRKLVALSVHDPVEGVPVVKDRIGSL